MDIKYLPKSWPLRLKRINARAERRIITVTKLSELTGIGRLSIDKAMNNETDIGLYKAAAIEREINKIEESQGYDWRADLELIAEIVSGHSA